MSTRQQPSSLMRTGQWWAVLLVVFLAPVPAQESSGTPPTSSSQEPPVAPTIPVTTVSDAPKTSEAQTTVLDSIVVTASKRAMFQRDLPGSVAAIQGQELEAEHAQGMKDYLARIPGVSYNDQGSEASVPIIRGIATEIGFGSAGQTTGIYLDDMPFADLFVPLSLPDLNPFDLERVEVLKGPQGTLFGSGALAGAVRYIARKPDHAVWEGKFMETTSRTNSSDGLARITAGALNAPLFGDALAFRAVGLLRRQTGLYDYSATDVSGNALRDDPDADGVRQSSGRLLASWNATSELKLSALYFDQKTHLDDAAFADQAKTPETTRAPFPSPSDHGFGGANLLVTYDFPWARLTSSTNRLTKHNRILTHAEWFFGLEQQKQDEWYDQAMSDVLGVTEELRLSSLDDADQGNWLLGAAYLKYRNAYFQYEPEPGPRGTPPPDNPAELSTMQRAQSFLFATIDSAATETAVFGEVTRRLGERWELTAGAREYETRLVADTVLSGAQIVALVQAPEDRQHFEPESHGFTPRLALRYLYNSNIQTYALAAKGFQFGGVQLNPASPVIVQSTEQAGFAFGPYKSSTLWNYETGIRTEWLDRRLRFDLAAFYLDWKDLQLTVRVPLSATSATIGVIANVGRAHSEGIESVLEVVPFEGARWISSAAWIKALTDVPFDQSNAAGPVAAGTRLPGTAGFQWSNVVSYTHALPYMTDWKLGPVFTHLHVGSSPDAIRPTGAVGGYDTFDFRLALTNPDSRFAPEISLGANNLSNVRAATYHSHTTSPTTGKPIDFYHFVKPRTVLLSLSLRY